MGLPNFTENIRHKLCCCVTNAKRVITIAWLISLVLVFVSFIVACIAVNRMQKMSQGSNQTTPWASFAAMWTCLLLIVLSFMGTVIMRRYQSSLAIGFFLGVIFIMCQQMLILFAIFAERAETPGEAIQLKQAQQAMASFSFFLFFVYGFFGTVLAVFRNDIVKQENAEPGPTPAVDAPPEYN